MRSAVVFDVDGVLVDLPHERAWQETLAELVRGEWSDIAAGTRYGQQLFDTVVYQNIVAGKPRLSGAQAILEYFGFPDIERRATRYADAKQRRLVELISSGAFHPFPDALRLVRRLRRRNVPLAAASSSKNANDMLRRIALDERTALAPAVDAGRMALFDCFAVNVCGVKVAKGKPAPDLFLLAAAELAVDPAACIVVEDAPAGVAAAKNGGMKAIGIARLHNEAMLSASGADLVVESLDLVRINSSPFGNLSISPA